MRNFRSSAMRDGGDEPPLPNERANRSSAIGAASTGSASAATVAATAAAAAAIIEVNQSTRRSAFRALMFLLVAVLVVDLAGAVVLGASNVGFDFHPFHWGSIDAFEDRTVDVFVLILARVCLCVVVAVPMRWWLVRGQATLERQLYERSSFTTADGDATTILSPRGEEAGLTPTTTDAAAERTAAAGHMVMNDSDDDDNETTSFIPPGGSPAKRSSSRWPKMHRRQGRATVPSATVVTSPVEVKLRGASAQRSPDSSPSRTDGRVAERDDEFNEIRQRAMLRARQRLQRNGVLLFLFACFTACNIYAAVKCLYFHFQLAPLQEITLATTVVWTNAELLLLTKFMERATGDSDADAMVRALHVHPLRFNPYVTCTKCDVCNQRVDKEGFECSGTCSFDCCLGCYRKKTAALGENMLRRTDKSSGVELGDADNVSPLRYVMRGMRIMLPFWRLVVVAMGCLIANQAVRVALPNFQGEVLDSVVTGNRAHFSFYIKCYAVLSVAVLLLSSIRGFCTQLVMRNVIFSLRERVFECLIYRDIAFFDGSTVGSLTARMTNDVNATVTPLRTLFNTVIANVILLFGGLVMCLLVSWKLAMISFSVVGPILFITSAYAKWSSKIMRSVWDSLAQANSRATEAFSNIRTVKAFSTESFELSQYSKTMGIALSQTTRDAVANAGSIFASSILDLGQAIIILAFGGLMAISSPQDLSVGQLVTFQLYVNMMNTAYQSLNGVLNDFTKSAGAAERVLTMLDASSSIDPRVGEVIPDMLFHGSLAFENVSFRYPMRPDRVALRRVSCVFPQGKVTAVVGRSGSGKSTMMHLLLRFYDPAEGRVTVDGVDMRSVKLQWLHQHMAVVAQDTQLFNATIADNIRYGESSAAASPFVSLLDGSSGGGEQRRRRGRRQRTATTALLQDEDGRAVASTTTTTTASAHGDEDDAWTPEGFRANMPPASDDDVRQAAMRANAHDFISSFPEGYRTMVGERGVRLSGGQRQRIAIARALLRRPTILLLDEATSALDAESEALVQDALDTLILDLTRTVDASELGGGDSCAIVVVAHRLSTVVNADNIIVLSDGEVVEEGTHAALLERRGAYFQLVHKQLSTTTASPAAAS